MKKTIAMLLAGMFTVSCGMVSASAADIEISLKNMQTDTIITGEIMYQDLETELENGSSIISPSYGDFQKLSVLYG